MMDKGFRMCAEYEEHEGTIIIWPFRPGSWGVNPHKARLAFANIIKELLKHETVYLIVQPGMAKNEWADYLSEDPKLKVLTIKTSDSWARDVSPIFVKNDKGKRIGINFSFNAWGGDYDGLYSDYEEDDAFAKAFCEAAGFEVYDASPFILEGGSIHTNGKGKLLSTRACLLSGGRNSSLSEEEIAGRLCELLGAEDFVWITRGIYNDETNEHVDNMCAFVSDNEVVLATCDDPSDPQYEMSELARKELLERGLKVHDLPVPKHPVCFSKEDLEGYTFEENEAIRVEGERLAASYVNFYIADKVVLVPQFGGDNAESDSLALKILKELFKDREVVGIYAKDILLGGGNIHCITMQIPL